MANPDDRYGQNWREAMRDALREGKVTTVITFNNTKYLITMHPIEQEPTATARTASGGAAAPSTPVQDTMCARCHRKIVLVDGNWLHAEITCCPAVSPPDASGR